MKKIVRVYPSISNNTTYIMAFIIDKCNYNCTYCFNKLIRTDNILDLDRLSWFVDKIMTLTDDKINLALSGGETTLHPKLKQFLYHYRNEKRMTIEIFTNCSNTLEFYNSITQNNVYFQCSLHNKRDFDISILKKINSERIGTINVMLDYRSFDKCFDDYLEIKKILPKANIACHLLDHCEKYYTDEQIKKYYSTERLNDNNLLTIEYDDGSMSEVTVTDMMNSNFNHWKCLAGEKYFNVLSNGDVKKCNMCGSILYNINNITDIKLKPTICTAVQCNHGIYIPKERIFK